MESETLIDDYEHVDESVIYTPVNIPGPGCDASCFNEQFVGCSCSVACGADCSCLRGASNYAGELLSLSSSPSLIYECHENCPCSQKCANRLVQRGPQPDLELIEVGSKGFGLRCKTDLTPGAFVCEYAGEVIGVEEARRRFSQRKGVSNYIFCLREHFGSNSILTFIDPTFIGNIGRYINHSCDPNLMIVPVRVGNAVPRICLFARRYIEHGTELTFDYGGGCESQLENAERNVERSVCHCGAIACLGYLPFDSSLF